VRPILLQGHGPESQRVVQDRCRVRVSRLPITHSDVNSGQQKLRRGGKAQEPGCFRSFGMSIMKSLKRWPSLSHVGTWLHKGSAADISVSRDSCREFDGEMRSNPV